MRFYYYLLFCSFFTLSSCSKDDICSENTATTPLLIITFKDRINVQQSKAVTDLRIVTNNGETEVINTSSTDSIAIPLNSNTTLTQYQFIKNSNSDNPATHLLSFNYGVEDVYINRACAFKAKYTELALDIENENTPNWIFTFGINQTTIENENETHVTILH